MSGKFLRYAARRPGSTSHAYAHSRPKRWSATWKPPRPAKRSTKRIPMGAMRYLWMRCLALRRSVRLLPVVTREGVYARGSRLRGSPLREPGLLLDRDTEGYLSPRGVGPSIRPPPAPAPALRRARCFVESWVSSSLGLPFWRASPGDWANHGRAKNLRHRKRRALRGGTRYRGSRATLANGSGIGARVAIAIAAVAARHVRPLF